MSLELYTNGNSTVEASAIGDVISLTNCSSKNLDGLTIYGKTTQNGTPTPESPVALETVGDDGNVAVTVCGKNLLKNILKTETYGGITYTVSDDGIITINGTSTGSWRNIQTSIYLEAGKTYTMSGVQKGGTTSTYYVYLEDAEKVRYIDTGNGVTFTPKVSGNGYVCAVVSKNATVSNIKICPQLEIGSVATEYEPYKGGSATVSTPNGLPGIPVSSGGNYTDANGQRWLCDEVDFTKGVYVQRVVLAKLTSTMNWKYSSSTNRFYTVISNAKADYSYRQFIGLCSHYPAGVQDKNVAISYINEGNEGVAIRDESRFSGDMNVFKSWLDTNDVWVCTLANRPVETALSAEQLSVFATLCTNAPNTTIYTDSNAVLKVNYRAVDKTNNANRYEISHAISVQMSKYYNEVGKLILVMPVNDYNIEALKNDRILYDTQKKIAYIIKNVKTDTPQNRITTNGYTTNHLLNSRVIAAPVAVKNVESGVYSVVNGNLRELSKVVTAATKGLTETTEITLYGGTVLEEIMPVLNNSDLGHDMAWNHRTEQHVFEVYKGKDLTTGIHAVVFSDEQGTARDLVINEDVSTFKNVAYVVSKFKDGDTEKELMEIVGNATGDDRHEQWFEISLNREENETEAQFRTRMRVHGAMELGKLIKRQSFNVVVDPAELGVLYNIGDIVSCVSKRFGVKFNARISGMKYKKDANSETTEVVLGEPKLTAIGEVKSSG